MVDTTMNQLTNVSLALKAVPHVNTMMPALTMSAVFHVLKANGHLTTRANVVTFLALRDVS
jgi:hypothetical protein